MAWGAGPPCRPGRLARFLFEGPRPAPPAGIHMAPEAPQQKSKDGPTNQVLSLRPIYQS